MANTTCFTSTIRMVGRGAICTGGTPSVPIWCIGTNCPSPFIRTRRATWCIRAAPSWTKRNSSGWKTGANDLLVAAYTSTKRGECITYSNDQGRTWTEYAGNPVVKHKGEGRDPRLLWHEPTRQWVMVVWSRDDSQTTPHDRSGIDFYTSPDLKHWTFRSRSGGFFECPDLFELPLENGKKKWVLTAADTGYRIGTFDGKKFQSETPKLPGQQGRDYYAAQTWSDEPKGRRVQIGWFRTETRGMPFNQSMSLPCELALKTTPDGPRLTWTPVRELEALRAQTHALGAFSLSSNTANPIAGLRGELVEVRAEFEPGTAPKSRSTCAACLWFTMRRMAKSQLVISALRLHYKMASKA